MESNHSSRKSGSGLQSASKTGADLAADFGLAPHQQHIPSPQAPNQRNNSEPPAAPSGATPITSSEGSEPGESGPKKPRSTRRRRGGRRRGSGSDAKAESADAEPAQAQGFSDRDGRDEGSAPSDSNSAGSRSRSKRGRRKRKSNRDSGAAQDSAEGQDREQSDVGFRQEADSEAAQDGGAGESRSRSSQRTRRVRGRSGAASKARASRSAGSDEREPRGDQDTQGESSGESKGENSPVRVRSTRRRRKSRSSSGEQAVEGKESSGAEAGRGTRGKAADSDEAGEQPKRRRRGTRGGRQRRGRNREDSAGGPVGVEAIPGEEDELSSLPDLPVDAEQVAAESGTEARDTGSRRSSSTRGKAKTSRKRGSSKGRRNAADGDAEETAPSRSRRASVKQPARRSAVKEVPRTQVILVNATDPEETRVAVTEGGRIIDFQMTVNRYQSLVNDIYRGRVVNIEQAIGAAFVDFGQGRNGFLHASDVLSAYSEDDWDLGNLLTTSVDEWSSQSADLDDDDDDQVKRSGQKRGGKKPIRRNRGPRTAINDLFKKGQMVAVQITKDAIGDKGPTLTTYISIPGRYLVLMPSLARTGVSRKIEDEKERRRLKRILQSLNIPEGMGVIVRTAGVGRKKSELGRDLDYLMAVWDAFGKRLVSGRNPAPLYQESDVAIRTMRDLFSAKTDKVIVDDNEVFERMVEFTRRLMPEHVDRIELHDAVRPLFHSHSMEQEFERMFAHRVELPSGGSIVFDQTEALVAIDVNSGRTREDGAGFEDIALKTNLEAAPEIARQIRLRDMGGIIVLDFIDMMRSSSRLAVERTFRECLVDDRARSKVGRISQFGILEMTRQRLGPGLSKLIFDPCSHCRGSGRVRTAESRAQAILRRLGSALTQKGFSTVDVRAHPEVVDYLERHCQDELAELAERFQRTLNMTRVADQVEDSVLRYLRADGREVRPGGRRKR